MRHIVMMSGGEESYGTGKLVVRDHGPEDATLLFADTRSEDEDLYRFLPQAATDIGAELVTVADGRDIWQVMEDERFLGNSRIDPCSKILKRQILRKWLDNNCHPEWTTVYIGYRHDEDGRIAKCLAYWHPWHVEFPLAEANVVKCDIRRWLDEAGIDPPRLYDDGFHHNNCGGGCIKAGIGQFVHLLKNRPESFARWEAGEGRLRDMLGDVAILRDRRQGVTKTMPLHVLRERVLAGETDLGRFEPMSACGCFAPD